MGLLSTEVEVKLCGKYIKYYENLGYEIPKYYDKKHQKYTVKNGTTIIVKVIHLPKNSNVYVNAVCDGCGKELRRMYNTYNKQIHDGKCYCHKCGNRILNSGVNSNNWNPNLTDEERSIGRNYPEYYNFIKRVLERDNYTCQCCGKICSGDAEVHHLNGYDWYIEGRTDETNSLVLCHTCHGNFHKHFGKGRNTREQYEEWIGYTVGELEKYDEVLPIARQVFDYERNKVFESAKSYAEIYGVNITNVRKCCGHRTCNRTIKHKDGTIHNNTYAVNTVKGHHLFWFDEYKNMTEEEISSVVNRENKGYKKVICLTTNKVFNTIVDGGREYNMNSPKNIGATCQGKTKSAGKLLDGTPLKWMYYEDFLKLSQEEQNEILSKNKDSSKGESFNM